MYGWDVAADIAPLRGEESVRKTVLHCPKSVGSNLGYKNDFVRFANGKWHVGFRCALPDLRGMGVMYPLITYLKTRFDAFRQ